MSMFDATARPMTEESKREKRRNIILLTLAGAAIASWLLFRFVTHTQTTDDAQIEGHVITVSSRVAGRVRAVLVRNNQTVAAGQVLVELEPEELATHLELMEAERAGANAALIAARAQLALTERGARASVAQARGAALQAGYGLRASNAASKQAEEDLRIARTRRARLESELASAALQLPVADAGAEPPQPMTSEALESARADEARAEARLAGATAHRSTSWGGIVAARGRLDEANGITERLEVARSNVARAEADHARAEARTKLARGELEQAAIRAPTAGSVGQLSVEVGQVATVDKPMLTIVSGDEPWVAANFKGKQVGKLRAGQSATVTVDAVGGRAFKAYVDSAAGTGLVRLRFASGADARTLKPGMGADVSVLVAD